MCGIAMILSGARVTVESHLYLYRGEEHRAGGAHPPASNSNSQEVYEPVLLLDNLKAALLRRGPDSLGSRKILLQSKCTNSVKKEDGEDKEEDLCLQINDNARECIVSSVEPGSTQDDPVTRIRSDAEIVLVGAILQLRGLSRVVQPLEDISGNLLVYNGEVFGGIHVTGDWNDGQALLVALEKCCSCGCHGLISREIACCCNANGQKSVPEILSTIRGPWALIYWQEQSKTIWFGRDAFGRRSLLVHWPTFDDSRFVLSSVSAPSSVRKVSDLEVVDMAHIATYWEELPCGIYSVHLKSSAENELCRKEKVVGQVMKHSWTDSLLNRLIKWERTNVEPRTEELSLRDLSLQMSKLQSETNGSLVNNCSLSGCMRPAKKVLIALKESVMRRTAINSILETYPDQNKAEMAPIALLFSGGLDSMILAALLDQCLDSKSCSGQSFCKDRGKGTSKNYS